MPDMYQKAAKELLGTDCAKELQVNRAVLMRYRDAMAGVVRSMGVNGATVEDVVHDAFETACRKAETDRPDPRDEVRFGGWLCALAKYAAMTTRNDNARSREVSSPTEELEDVADSHRAYIGHYDDKVAASSVFAGLNADDRALLHQHFYEDKTVQELAIEQGVPWSTMKSRLDGVLHRARTIMVDDRTHRRRGAGAVILAALALCFRETYVKLRSSWTSKRAALPLVAGFATGAMVTAVLVHKQVDSAKSTYITQKIETTATSAAEHASFSAAVRAPAACKGCSKSAATPIRKPAANTGVHYGSRAITQWAVGNSFTPTGKSRKSIP